MSTTEIERRPLTPLDIGETKAAQKLYQDGLKQLLDRAEDVTPIRGKGGKVKNHVNRSGVSKITTWCSLSTTLVGEPTVERDEDGKPLRWRVTVRAAAPDGRVADGVGAFDVKERPSNKPEHDGLGTAFTRARNRAVMDLVGMGEVSAEEIVPGGTAADGSELPYGPEATLDLAVKAQEAIPRFLPGVPGEAALKILTNNFGYLPEIAARTIMGMDWLKLHPAPPPGPTTQAPPQPPVRSSEGTEAPTPAHAPTGQGPAAQGPTIASPPEANRGPEFDDMVTAAEVVDDLDEVDIDGLLDDPRK